MTRLHASEFFDGHTHECNKLQGVRAKFVELQPGMMVSLYNGDGNSASSFSLLNDSHYVHFSCLLQGIIEARVKGQVFTLGIGEGHIGFIPGENLSIRSCPAFRHMELMVTPERLAELVGNELGRIGGDLERGFIMKGSQLGHQINYAAHQLAQRIDCSFSHPLLLQSAALEFLGWHFSGLSVGESDERITPRVRKQLLAARERLLQDLGSPPTITELAGETGLNQLKLKQGFKTLFGTSIYSLFQRHRMDQARILLRHHNVTETAMILGYSNISHFSVAFRKQFGLLPSHARKRSII